MLFLLLACSTPAPPPPQAPPPKPEAPAPFDCMVWAGQQHVTVDTCSESPHLPGLWLLQSRAGGDTRYVAIKEGKQQKGGGSAVAAFLRADAAWDHPLDAEDIAGVLLAFRSYPPGFTTGSVAAFEPPFTYRLTSPFADWQAHGGPNAVAGAMPTGPNLRATLTGGAEAPIQWVVESGSGSDWSPVATIQWDRGPSRPPSN